MLLPSLAILFFLLYALVNPSILFGSSKDRKITMIIREQKQGETASLAVEAYEGDKNALGKIDVVGQDNIVAKVVRQGSPPKFEIVSTIPEDRVGEIVKHFTQVINLKK